jgi:hypothetical protein
MRAIGIALLVAAVPFGQAWGWGQEGHSIVAEIAQRRLDAPTLEKIEALLVAEDPALKHPSVALASLASWADDYRATHPETAGWHFVDIPMDRATYDPSVDCKNDNCAVAAILHFKEVLGDCARSAGERLEALKFVVHFIGDIHQPLHSSDRWDPYTGKDDQGGNLVPVTFFGQSTNLHAVWDTGLIMRTVYDWGAYVVRLETTWFPGRDLTALKNGTPADWAVEAHQLATVAYDYPDDGILGLEYLNKGLPVVDRQLALAGVRLAQTLQDALRPTNSCP